MATQMDILFDFFKKYLEDSNFRSSVDNLNTISAAFISAGVTDATQRRLIGSPQFQAALSSAVNSMNATVNEMAVQMAAGIASCVPSYDNNFGGGGGGGGGGGPGGGITGLGVGNTFSFKMKADWVSPHAIADHLSHWHYADAAGKARIKTQIISLEGRFRSMVPAAGAVASNPQEIIALEMAEAARKASAAI